MITIKSKSEIERMRAAGQVVKAVLELVGQHVRSGVSTWELDRIAEEYILSCGAVPSFKGYRGYPATLCVSIDDEVVHGIPNPNRIIQEGSIVSVDVGAILNGFHGDAARTFFAGKVSPEKERLVRVTQESFFEGIRYAKEGCRMGDIGNAIQQYCEKNGYSVVRALTGHGIGRAMHEDPEVPNFGQAGRGLRLSKGMTLAIEPMVNMGVFGVDFLSDGWTVRTKDGLPSAHYENTIVITDGDPEILTL